MLICANTCVFVDSCLLVQIITRGNGKIRSVNSSVALIHRRLLRFKNVLKLLFVLITKVNVKQCINTVYSIWVVTIFKLCGYTVL